VNGAYYSCADREAFTRCMGFDVDACLAACDPANFDCIDGCFAMLDATEPDPSACDRDASHDGECGSPTPSPSPGTCVDDPTGQACDYDSHCASNNCYRGHCYPNTVGSRCDYDSDCSSNNCYENCCRGNSIGSSCDYDSDCDSNNCYRNRCEGNTAGSGCDYDSDCDSRACVGNRCQ
jgi:hypothetical protein